MHTHNPLSFLERARRLEHRLELARSGERGRVVAAADRLAGDEDCTCVRV